MIRLSKSCISEAEKQAVREVLDHEYLGMGEYVHRFEDLLTNYFQRPVACVNTGTAALHLALQACEIGCGDEVLIQSITYVASFQAISATGAKPIPCEVEPSTVTIDLKDVEKRLNSKTKAIMPVHYSGGVGNLSEIYNFAKLNGLRVIEDAAHAFGTIYEGKRIGSFGDIACFSFDGIKNITCGEGGCIVTTDKDVLKKVSDARLVGVENDTEKRFAGTRSWDFDVSQQGWRYHMSNIMAAIGIEQFNRFSEFSSKRQKLAKLYVSKLKNHPKIKLLNLDYDLVVPHIFVVRVIDTDREILKGKLLELGIQTGFHYKPNHLLSLYYPNIKEPLPITELLASQLVTLPLHPDLKENDIDFICKALSEIL